jgi:ferric-dicitrate binding protein FerR (iron transport regulator)
MDKQAFLRMLDKYQDGTASSAEKTLIEEYYRRLEMAGTTELSAEEEIALRQAMYKNITAGMVEREPVVVPFRRKNYSLAAAAAVLLIAIGAGSYFWLFKEQTTQPRNNNMAKAKHHDLPPGRDAATLTLADGRTIVLDSASGTISKQGGATVINLNGQVSYAKAGDKNEQVQVVYNTITTARGNQYQLILADGSKVWLNSASSLRFPTAFTGDKREVELDGEGYFEVATLRLRSGQKMPFHVKTSTQDIEVLGTHFNVNAYKDEETIKTTLLEGRVKVGSGQWAVGRREKAEGPVLSREQKAENKNYEVILKPGEQAVSSGAHSPLTIDHSPDLDQVMAWKNGWFEFDSTDIKTIMRQISRWYDVDVRYEVKPNNETYGGRISRNLNLSNILKMLETYGVHYRLENKILVVVK